jgi:hypothetical protein
MTEYEDVIDVYQGMGPTCEHYQTCPNKCYAYEYAYGYTTVHVFIRGHDIQFGWTYHDIAGTVRDESEAIDVVCGAARLAQLEDYGTLGHGRHPEQHNPVLG